MQTEDWSLTDKQLAQVQAEIERFGRLIVIELGKIRTGATVAELSHAIDNAMRRYKFEEQDAA